MTDDLTPDQRRLCMAAVKGKHTQPELIIRRLAHSLGFRYRLHVDSLPGKPDLVFPSRRKVIFVHGCFWHSHRCKHGLKAPASNVNYWTRKRTRNRERDAKHIKELKRAGWQPLVIWECWLRAPKTLPDRLERFLR